MKVSFKQFNDLANLTEDQVTEEKLEEIFGAFFGSKKPEEKKAATADLKTRKAGLQTALKGKQGALAQNTAALSQKEKDWRNWIHDENSKKSGIGAEKKIDKLPTSRYTAAQARAAERDWVHGLKKEGYFSEARETVIPYKGYKIKKTEGGNYHVMKGPRFIGHGKDHQEAMKVADKDMEKNEA